MGAGTKPEDVVDTDSDTPTYERYCDDVDDTNPETEDIDIEEDRLKRQVIDKVTPEVLDQYLNAEVLLPLGKKMVTGKVTKRKRNTEGELTGTANNNPLLDTRSYEVVFPSGDQAEYSANMIAQNMYAQCDSEGNQFLLMESIVDHKSDGHAVETSDMFTITKGRKYMRKTTEGWQLCIQ